MHVTIQTAAFECVARRMLGVTDDGYEPNTPYMLWNYKSFLFSALLEHMRPSRQ
jgi:hypothetical protein